MISPISSIVPGYNERYYSKEVEYKKKNKKKFISSCKENNKSTGKHVDILI